MSIPRPHFLLFSDASPARRQPSSCQAAGGWRFVLEAVSGNEKLEAADVEACESGDRLNLLAVVRGLEALDQPSRVTLVTSSRYVARGLRYGLQEWRENGWQWERFGQMAPIPNRDLWQRIDRALQFHRLECRTVGAASRGAMEPWEPASENSSDDVQRGVRHTARPAAHGRRLGATLRRIVNFLTGSSAAEKLAPSHVAC